MIRGLIALILVVSLVGCNFANKTEKAGFQGNNSAGNGTSIGQPPEGDNDRVNTPDTPVSSHLRPNNGPGIYPPEVKDLIETMKTIEGGSWVIIGDQTFIVVSRGEKPTTGYGIKISELKTEGDRAVVYVSLTDPKEGSAVAEVITYPYVVETIKGRFTDVEFKDANHKIEYIPRVVGLKDQYLAKGNGNIRLISQQFDGSKIAITGIARVFEANVNYELQDAQGNVLQQGYTMAASGAPDWGFFQLEINNYPPATAKIKIYQASPEDGSHQDVVIVDIK